MSICQLEISMDQRWPFTCDSNRVAFDICYSWLFVFNGVYVGLFHHRASHCRSISLNIKARLSNNTIVWCYSHKHRLILFCCTNLTFFFNSVWQSQSYFIWKTKKPLFNVRFCTWVTVIQYSICIVQRTHMTFKKIYNNNTCCSCRWREMKWNFR